MCSIRQLVWGFAMLLVPAAAAAQGLRHRRDW